MNLVARCLVAAILLLLPSCIYAEPTPVKIGVLLTLTGSMSNWGQSAREGLILAQESINSASATQNDPRIQLVFEDYGNFDLKRAVSAAHKLITVDKVDVLFSYLTEDTEVVWKIAAQNNVPVIAMAAGAADVTTGRPNVFRMSPSDIDLMTAALKFVSSRKWTNICIVNHQIAYFEDMSSFLEHKWSGRKAEPILRIDLAPAEKDFRGAIGRLKARGCEVLFALVLPDSMRTLLQQLRVVKFLPSIVGPPGAADPAILSLPSEITDGVVFARFEDPSDDFAQRFRTRFGHAPGITADYGYDALTVLHSVVSRFGSSAEEVSRGLVHVKGHRGASGTIDINADRTRTSRRVQIWEIRGGKAIVAREP
ncbi:MAG: ABC transporter substrate-binding protein [Pseudomonadota bacterium]|jgi:branched-chain amino acid transport system substrate-binding protein